VINIYKITIILLTVTIFFTSLILPMQKAEAMTFTPSSMAIATKVVRGIGEKLGINWTKGALDAVVGYIAGQSGVEGHEPILPFWWLFGTTPDTIPLDDDKSLVRLTPDDFKGGSKAIKDAIDAVVPEAVVPIYGKCYKPIYGTRNPVYNTYTYFDLFVGPWERKIAVSGNNLPTDSVMSITSYAFSYSGGTSYYSVYYSIRSASANTIIDSSGTLYESNSSWVIPQAGVPVEFGLTDYYTQPSDLCNYPVTINDVTNITTVNNNMWNTTTNNYNYYDNYDVTIINVGDGTENVDVPVNPPLTPEETGNISDPPPPPPQDTDNDGIPDSTDITPGGETPTPDDTGIFAKLFPVLLIVKLFGVLGSCLMYLVRMFQFIMTIPGIDAIPIDNDAFVWFRSAQIVGIKIYDVVSSLAGVGLSFIVFRAIRRAYL
jgi:hypothetical protein